jgi:hypothetical protein
MRHLQGKELIGSQEDVFFPIGTMVIANRTGPLETRLRAPGTFLPYFSKLAAKSLVPRPRNWWFVVPYHLTISPRAERPDRDLHWPG